MHAGEFALRAIAVTTMLVSAHAASGQDTVNLSNATCLGCHGVAGFAAPGTDGQSRSLFVPADRFAGSVHGQALRCIDCHSTMLLVMMAIGFGGHLL